MDFIKKNKYKLAVIALIFILISVISQPTLAYYVLQGTSTSIVTTGKVEISILETLNGEVCEGEEFNIAPGSVLKKAFYVQNTGGHPCWLRINIAKYNEEGFSIRDAEKIIRLNISNEHWFYNATDDYYYYRTILPADSTSSCLYDQIRIDVEGTETETDYSNHKVYLSMQVEAIQSENNQKISYIRTSEDISQVWPSGLNIETGEVRP